MIKTEIKNSVFDYNRFDRIISSLWFFDVIYKKYQRTTIMGLYISFIIITVFIFRDFLAFIQYYPVLGIVDILVALTLIGVILNHRKSKHHYNHVAEMGISIFGCLFFYLFISGAAGSTTFVWYYVFPLIALFILGSRRGTIATLLLLIPTLFVLVFDKSIPFATQYPPGLKLRFIPSILVVLGLSYLYEKSREMTQNNLNLANIELRKSYEEMEQRVQERTAELNLLNQQMSQEITERSHAEEALKEANDIINKSPAVAFLWKNEEDWPVEFVSDNVQNIFEYTAVEFVSGRIPYRKTIHPDDLEMVTREVAGHNGEVVRERLSHKPYRIITKRGTVKWIDDKTFVKRDAAGRITHYQGIVEDITDKKKAEEAQERLKSQLLQAQKMEAIGTLAGGIAHDFNNLLMGILGYTTLMLLHTDKDDSHYEKLRAIESQVQSGAELTKQILGFARGGRYEVKPTDLNNLINKTISMFSRTKKEIRIFEKYSESLCIADVDRVQIEQVLLNLLVNACQAMPGGGDIHIETENVVLNERGSKPFMIKAGSYVKVSIADTGIGMDKKTQERIFDPFFTTKEMGRGTGLGLASTYGIIKGHGGFINVYSEKGHGTKFTIHLPVSNNHISTEQNSPPEILRGHETILVVDDEKIISDVTKEMLEGLGYKVLTANSGQEAIETYKANRQTVDMVILDMIMPGTGGGAVFDALKSLDSNIKVILSSGYSINEEATVIMERGVKAFLQKPFKIDALSQKVRNILDN